jgi:hypothetical protein
MEENRAQKNKRRHRDVDRYFEGYEKRTRLDPATGRKKTEYVYTGEYFTYDLEEKHWQRFRLLSTVRIAASCALFVLANLMGPQGSATFYVGITALCAIIPLIYLLIGLAGLLGTRSSTMTLREHTYGLARVQHAAWGAAVLWGLSLVGELFYILRYQAFTSLELAATALQLMGLAGLIWQIRAIKQIESKCTNAPQSQYDRVDDEIAYDSQDETETSEGDDTNGSCR